MAVSLKILQISDLHFGPPYLPEVGQALLRFAPDIHPDAIIISGDLTQRAKPEQFQQAKKFLDELPDVPQLVIPGNHDVPLYRLRERWSTPHQEYRRQITDELNPILWLDGAVVVGLDSTAPRSAVTNGRIHQWQLDLCRRTFADVPPETTKIVVAHHHFAPAPDYLHDSTMPKARRALEQFQEMGVEMVMGGHLHRAYVGNSLDIYPGADREHGIVIVQSGTSTSRRGRGREREKNSFNVIEVQEETFEITHHMYFDDRHGFIATSRHLFSRPQRHIGLPPRFVPTATT